VYWEDIHIPIKQRDTSYRDNFGEADVPEVNASDVILAMEKEIDAYDVSRMWAARYPGARDYIWLVNANTGPQLYTLAVGNYPVFLPPGGLSGQMYGTLFGRPVVETDYNP
jgi:HK97 family phage major capsid protein